MEFTTSTEDNHLRRWFEATGQPVYDAEGRQQWGVAVIRDITERSLRRLQDEFVALASQELRGPLEPLEAHLRSLANQFAKAPPESPERRAVAAAQAQAGRFARLVRDLVDVRRLQSGQFRIEPQRITLNPLVTQTVHDAQAIAQDQTIRLAETEEPLVVLGDAERLKQVVFNLLMNAITYARSSATIDVRLRRAGDEAEIQVQDYGPGIEAAELEHIFSMRLQLGHDSREGKGLGLGLYIAKAIVDAHGGQITVNSAPGAGATFTIRLPLAK